MRNLPSIGWCLVPLMLGIAFGYAVNHRSSSPLSVDPVTDAGAPKPDLTNTRSEKTTTTAADKLVPTPSVPPPASLEELLELAREIGNHYRISEARLGLALQGVDDDLIAEWYRELKATDEGRRYDQRLTTKRYAFEAVAERLAVVSPELALAELAGGQKQMAAYLATAHPSRVPEFLSALEKPELREALLATHLLGIKGKNLAETDQLRRAFVEEHGNAKDLADYDKNLVPYLEGDALPAVSFSPTELLERLRSYAAAEKKDYLAPRIAGQIARHFQTAEAALEFAKENGIAEMSNQVKQQFYGGVFSRYMQQDPQAASAWLTGLSPEMMKATLAESVWPATQADPAATRDLIDRIDPALLPRHGLGSIAWLSAAADPDSGALDWYLEKTNNGADVAKGVFDDTLRNIARHDPSSVAKFLLENPDSMKDVGSSVAGILVHNDTTHAPMLLEKIEGARRAGEVGTAIGQAFYQKDPAAAREFVATQTDPNIRQALIDGIASSARQKDWQATLDWAGNLEGTERDRALSSLLVGATNDPNTSAQVASEWLGGASDEILTKKETRESIVAVGKALAESSPTAAGKWASELPAGTAREAAIATVSESWSSFDPAGTSEWLATLPPSAALDTAAENLVTNITDDPVAAFEWGMIVGDEAKRRELLGGVVRRWGRSDPDAARAAIAGAADLPAAERQQLLQALDDAN